MAFEIKDLSIGSGGKRYDMKVAVKPFWGGAWSFQLRLLAYESIENESLEEIVDQVIDRRGEWKPAKKNLLLKVDGNTTAFILSTQNDQEHE